ncbi:MAG: hypothetical protein ACKOOG_10225, partial [Actinomycetota bacterium]
SPMAKLRAAGFAAIFLGTAVTSVQRRFTRFRSRIHNAGSAAVAHADDPGSIFVLLGVALLDAGDRPEVQAALPDPGRARRRSG